MAINFNQEPYRDDFDVRKNFHKILFKPEYSVQARELTQSQTILQDQVSSFANHVFKNYSPVTGGQVTTNFQVRFLKLDCLCSLGRDVDPSFFVDQVISNTDNTVFGKVLYTIPKTVDNDGNVINPDRKSVV